MQLTKKNRQIGARLALATGALLGAAAAQCDDGWQMDSAVMLYNESDSRVKAVEPVINLKRTWDDGSTLNFRMAYDSLTGSSPNGAARANKPQTFTSASGGTTANSGETTTASTKTTSTVQTRTTSSGRVITSTNNREDDEDSGSSQTGSADSETESQGSAYTVQPGDLPLDSSFEDQRVMGSLGWSKPFAEHYTLNLGGAYSQEQDFRSASVNGAIMRDFNNKNTTVSLGTNLEYDAIDPMGDVPTPLSSYASNDKAGNNDTKEVRDLMVGLTQVMGRRWLTQLNFSISESDGYQNDPYKFLTVASNGNLIADPADANTYLYLYENRPDKREKKSVFWQNKFALFSSDAIDLDYRYMTDDWGIKSDTVDATYHWQVGDHFYVEPHYRYYRQDQADFYQPFLDTATDVRISGGNVTPLVDYASSDPRLGAFSADTVGLKLGFPLSQDEEITVKAEYYQQHDKNSAQTVPQGSDLYGYAQFPELKAGWIQVSYHYRW